MLFVLLWVLILGISSGYMIPRCHFIYTDYNVPGDDPIPPHSCKHTNDYIFSNGMRFQTPFPDCNRCRCLEGTLQCCLFGIKAGPLAVHNACEVLQVNGTCDYKIVLKYNNNEKCPF